DGHSGGGEAGSTAEVAKLLNAPVVLVIDAAKMARSAGAVALGYQRFDPALRLAGVIFNGVASPRHFEMVAEPVRAATGLPVFGYLPRTSELSLPERHLGLVPAAERAPDGDFFGRLADLVAHHLDLEAILGLARSAPDLAPAEAPDLFPAVPPPRRVRLAIAQDRAFNFYYPDALDLLTAWGAELVPFSPLRDAFLPEAVGGVY